MDKKVAGKLETLSILLRNIKQKSFMALKSTKFVSEDQLRVLVALVVLYRDFLDDPSLSERILAENEGVNQELFRAYYSNATRMFKVIEGTQRILHDDGVRPENVRFARTLLSRVGTLSSAGGAVDEAVVNIFDFARGFISFYEENYSLETRKRFSFAARVSQPSEPEILAKNPSKVEPAFRLSLSSEKLAPLENSSKLISKGPLKIQSFAANFTQSFDQVQYKRKLGITAPSKPTEGSQSKNVGNFSSSKLLSEPKGNSSEKAQTSIQNIPDRVKSKPDIEKHSTVASTAGKSKGSSVTAKRGSSSNFTSKGASTLIPKKTPTPAKQPPRAPSVQTRSQTQRSTPAVEKEVKLPVKALPAKIDRASPVFAVQNLAVTFGNVQRTFEEPPKSERKLSLVAPKSSLPHCAPQPLENDSIFDPAPHHESSVIGEQAESRVCDDRPSVIESRVCDERPSVVESRVCEERASVRSESKKSSRSQEKVENFFTSDRDSQHSYDHFESARNPPLQESEIHVEHYEKDHESNEPEIEIDDPEHEEESEQHDQKLKEQEEYQQEPEEDQDEADPSHTSERQDLENHSQAKEEADQVSQISAEAEENKQSEPKSPSEERVFNPSPSIKPAPRKIEIQNLPNSPPSAVSPKNSKPALPKKQKDFGSLSSSRGVRGIHSSVSINMTKSHRAIGKSLISEKPPVPRQFGQKSPSRAVPRASSSSVSKSLLFRPRSNSISIKPVDKEPRKTVGSRPTTRKSVEQLKALPIVANNSISLNARSIIKTYIERAEVRERFVAEDREMCKEQIELNKLRIEAERAKFLIEKEAIQKCKEDFTVKEKDVNHYKEFTEKYKDFAEDKKKEDKDFIRRIRDEAREDLKQSKRAMEMEEETRQIMAKLEKAQQNQTHLAKLVERVPREVDKECFSVKTDEQLRRELNDVKKKVDICELEKQKNELKSELGFLKGLYKKNLAEVK